MPEGLNTNSKQEDIKKQIADLESAKAEAEASFDGVEAGTIEKQIRALQETIKGLGENLPPAEMNSAELSQVENMGGDKEVVAEKTAEVDGKIAEKEGEIGKVEEEVEEKVAEVGQEKQKGIADADAEKFQAFQESFNTRFEETAAEVKKNIEAYLTSGELEKTREFSDAENAINNNQFGKTQFEATKYKMEKVKELAREKIIELQKPLDKLQTDINSNLYANQQNKHGEFLAGINAQIDNALSFGTGSAPFGLKIPAYDYLLNKYRERVKIYIAAHPEN
jgi:hypothetical protein